jgi:hypothetical protein
MRRAVSVTLDEDNLLWLRAQAHTTAKGSLSAVLDQIVGEARTQGRTTTGAVRSVAGTIDLPADDPDLDQASAYVRAIFGHSLSRPMVVREDAPGRRTRRTARRRG